jgi:hypothetical protein
MRGFFVSHRFNLFFSTVILTLPRPMPIITALALELDECQSGGFPAAKIRMNSISRRMIRRE